ncbi:bifunctional transcriptional activator/DNA repair enzyme AdaA [Acinetobacter sp. ANC 4173]|uniref:bifunctional transcriptional activator/DNA repair enzyme AdaA n=1 Tax=Acinetobacter sp. ANC 4173 TaxID=2529837 RepID=UPI00104056CE|nr:methylated-DNA--[protein]-cysteine S-methyltransferase [Acinetobacter sp. ANC 4173]TCB78762.1 methylated-DNA--[protein]-cysteine S-methyltransferase [Acinetobacter sp. ANC 4173]
MSSQQHYQRVAQAIEYIQRHFQHQPTLDDIAAHVHLSPAYFQRLFSEWAGTSPKKFLQYISVEHAKSILTSTASHSLLDATYDTGLSSGSRLHDLFIQIEGMTPAEYKQGGAGLKIFYSFAETLFGCILVASTPKGICTLTFVEQNEQALNELKAKFPHAEYIEQTDEMQQRALAVLTVQPNSIQHIKLHLKGSAFQLKVWESLLKIPAGQLASYRDVASQIEQPKAARAVGSAVAHNPVAFLIPCHRVIQASGVLGNYHWGTTRKTAMIGWESAQLYANVEEF